MYPRQYIQVIFEKWLEFWVSIGGGGGRWSLLGFGKFIFIWGVWGNGFA